MSTYPQYLEPLEGYDAIARQPAGNGIPLTISTTTSAGMIFGSYPQPTFAYHTPHKWRCAHCGRKNKSDRESCVACGAPDLT